MGIQQRLRRIGDLFGRQLAKPSRAAGMPFRAPSAGMISAGTKQVGDCMRRVGPDLKNAVLRHLAVAGLVTGLALPIGSGAVFAQSGTPAPDQQGKPPAANSA